MLSKGYTQSPIIRNGPIRLGIEFWGKFKKRALGTFQMFNYGFCGYGRLFLEKFKKQLRNGQLSSLKY